MYRDSCEHGIISPCIYLKNSQLTQRCLTVHSGKCWLSVVFLCAVLSVCGGCAAALKLSSHYRLPVRDSHYIVCGSQAVDCLRSDTYVNINLPRASGVYYSYSFWGDIHYIWGTPGGHHSLIAKYFRCRIANDNICVLCYRAHTASERSIF